MRKVQENKHFAFEHPGAMRMAPKTSCSPCWLSSSLLVVSPFKVVSTIVVVEMSGLLDFNDCEQISCGAAYSSDLICVIL